MEDAETGLFPADSSEHHTDVIVRIADQLKGTDMTAATQNLEQTLLSSSLGQSVLDSIVQANIDLRTVSAAAIDSMMQAEQRRRVDSTWASSEHLCSVCG